MNRRWTPLTLHFRSTFLQGWGKPLSLHSQGEITDLLPHCTGVSTISKHRAWVPVFSSHIISPILHAALLASWEGAVPE